MEIGSLINTGVQGFQNATSRASQAAQDIASQSVAEPSAENVDSNQVEQTESKDLTSSLVELNQAEIEAKANVQVIETASDLVGSLLDVKA